MGEAATLALSVEDVRSRIAEAAGGAIQAPPVQSARRYKYVRPFSTAADGLIEYAQNPEGRFLLGLHDIDVMTRGFGRGELVYITGRAHSGKTQVVLNGVNANPDKRILYFTPDEVSELVLSKLVGIRHGLDAEVVEQRIKSGDDYTIDLVRRTATKDFPNFIVIDESISLSQMHEAVKEAEDYWGDKVDAVMIDFLELIPGEEGVEGVTAKSQALKRWGKEIDAPVLCLHQASRSSGSRGQSAGMNAMRYGGETEATFVMEVFRKREDESLDAWERDRHQNTVSINLDKNKRPPCKKGVRDFYLDPQNGLVRPLTAADGGAHVSTAQALVDSSKPTDQLVGQTSWDEF